MAAAPGRAATRSPPSSAIPRASAQPRSARPEPFTFPLARPGARARAARRHPRRCVLGERAAARARSSSLWVRAGGCAWPGVRATATAVVATANVSRGFDGDGVGA